MFRFNKIYFMLTVLSLVTEISIALYLHDAYIRPFGGDFLVVILIYCFVKSIFNSNVINTAVGVLILANAVEVSQYFHIINYIGLQNSGTARVIMGTDFSWTDMLMYTLGILLVWLVERILKRA